MKLDIKIEDQDLPVLSIVASQALQLIQDPRTTNQKIKDLICQDPSLAARVLRVANSPFFSGRIPAFTISDALFRLGIANLTNVIVVAATGEFFNESDPVIQFLWDHSKLVAMSASYLAKLLAFENVEEVFVAGLLHDIGKLVILHQYPDIYKPMLQEAVLSHKRLHLLEDESFNFFNHMTIGGLVINKWKLHASIAETARFHHDQETRVPYHVNFPRIVGVVSLTNLLCDMVLSEGVPDQLSPAALQVYTQTLGISEQKLMETVAKLYQEIRNRYMTIQ